MEINYRGGWALIRKTWARYLSEPSFFFLLAFGWMIPPLIYLFVWSTAAGGGTVGGLNAGQFTAYYLTLILVNQTTYCINNWVLGDLIRYGHMNNVLLRPVPVIFDTLSAEFASKVVFLLFDIPVVALLAWVLRPDFSATTGRDVLFFLPALLLAWALRFLWGYWLALLAFWVARADALLTVQDSLVFLLAGQVAPIALLPGFLQSAAVVLPFRYMLSFPVEVLLGHVDAAGLASGFALQTAWLAAAAVLSIIVWRSGVRRYSAVGG
jgi:ABC-2 type transport system permease protein